MCKRPLFLAGCFYLAVTAVAFSVDTVLLLLLSAVFLAGIVLLSASRKKMFLLGLAAMTAAVLSVDLWEAKAQEQQYYAGETVVLEGMVTDCEIYNSVLRYTIQAPLGKQTLSITVWSDNKEQIEPGNKVSALVALEEKEKMYWYDGCILSAQAQSMEDLGMAQGIKAESLRLRSLLHKRIESLFYGKGREVMLALLLGEKADLSQEVEQVFLKSGTLHLLTVSGFHFSIIAAGCFAVLQLLRQNPKTAALLSIPLLFLLAMIEGMTLSVTRAFLMLLFSYMAKLLERDYDGLTAWSAAAMLILFPEPMRLFSPSFLLSFSAVLGILLFAPALTTALQRYLLLFSNQHGRFHRTLNSLCQLCGVCMGANVLTAPFLLYFFGSLPLLSLLSAVLLAPLLPVLIGLGVIAVFMPLQAVAPFFADAAQLLTAVLYRILLEISELDLIYYGEDNLLLAAMILLYVLLFLLYLLKATMSKAQRAVCAYLSGAALLLILHGTMTPLDLELYVCRRSLVLCKERRAVIAGDIEKDSDREEIERILHSQQVETVELLLLNTETNRGGHHALELVKNWKPQSIFTAEEMDVLDVSEVHYTASPKQTIEFWEDWSLSLSDGSIVLSDGERKFLKLHEKYAIITAYKPEYAAVLGDDYMVYGEEALLWEKTWQAALKLTLEDKE